MMYTLKLKINNFQNISKIYYFENIPFPLSIFQVFR